MVPYLHLFSEIMHKMLFGKICIIFFLNDAGTTPILDEFSEQHRTKAS